MSPIQTHNRNYSFPPALSFRHVHSKELRRPPSNIDDEPWLHFLSKPVEEEDYSDYLHFDAGILAGTEATKRKANKFRPVEEKRDGPSVRYHHGAYQRDDDGQGHGFVEDIRGSLLPVEHNMTTARHAGDVSRHSMTHRRTHHHFHRNRHSWQGPSDHLFTLDEEIPELNLNALESVPAIVVSDFDMHLTQLATNHITFASSGVGNTEDQTDSDFNVVGQASAPHIEEVAVPSEQTSQDVHHTTFLGRARL